MGKHFFQVQQNTTNLYIVSNKHLPFIQTLGNIILVAIENKRLAKENLSQEILNKELEMATEMQNMLFKNEMPKNQFYEAGIFYKPLSNVGGDIYDYIKANDDESFFCLADVSGKGIAAALLMANFLKRDRQRLATLEYGFTLKMMGEYLIKNLNKKF